MSSFYSSQSSPSSDIDLPLQPPPLTRRFLALPPLSTNFAHSPDSFASSNPANNQDTPVSGNTHSLVYRGSTYTWTVPPAPTTTTTQDSYPCAHTYDPELSPLDITMDNGDCCASLLFSDSGENHNGLITVEHQINVDSVPVLGLHHPHHQNIPCTNDRVSTASSLEVHRDSPVPWSPRWDTAELDPEDTLEATQVHYPLGYYTTSGSSFPYAPGAPEDVTGPLGFASDDYDFVLPVSTTDDIAAYFHGLSIHDPRSITPSTGGNLSHAMRPTLFQPQRDALGLYRPDLPLPAVSEGQDLYSTGFGSGSGLSSQNSLSASAYYWHTGLSAGNTTAMGFSSAQDPAQEADWDLQLPSTPRDGTY